MHRDSIDDLRKLFVGLDKKVNINGKGRIVPINFDNAATTPPFKRVVKRVLETTEYYGSIARGDGQKSQYCSDLYEECRRYILKYFNAPEEIYTAILVGNTTDGLNKLSNILINNKEDIVITTRMEHHSNDLPWRNKCDLKYVEVNEDGRININEIEELIERYKEKVKYITITGASNVTGYINDIRKISGLIHKYGGKIIVDGAQLVPHKKIYMYKKDSLENIDFLVFSGHKIYAPFGSGAIIGLRKDFNNNLPDTKGGGTVEYEGSKLQQTKQIYPHKNLKEIIQYIEDNGISFYDYVLNYEDEHFKAYLFEVLDSMFTCVQNGLHHEGVIPGRLQLKRVAKSMYQQAINTRRESDRERLLVSSYAYAVSEENACGNKIVTAPTCGASGILPAVLFYCYKQLEIPR